MLSINSNAIHILENNLDKINWNQLSTNPNAIHLLKSHRMNINWQFISSNPSIFEIDIEKLKLDITKKAKNIDCN
jgi:hypothetical protein